MAFAVNDFEDLLKIIEAQPEWRSRLRRVLFPEIDIPKALQALAEAQLQTNALLKKMDARIERLEIGQEQLKQDVGDRSRQLQSEQKVSNLLLYYTI